MRLFFDKFSGDLCLMTSRTNIENLIMYTKVHVLLTCPLTSHLCPDCNNIEELLSISPNSVAKIFCDILKHFS